MRQGLPEGAKIERVVPVGEEAKWLIERHGQVDQMHLRMPDGTLEIQFRVQIWDPGREAFITRWFGDAEPAQGLLEKIRENSEYDPQEAGDG